ncbi:MAG: peptidylprolyl isomerase [Acidobacteria bacterium]|nr:peptidylprolyl isomerase [Acidobacteriota bacterium]
MPAKQYSAPPPVAIDPNKSYTATLETSRGPIVCELFARDAPVTVNNFVFLAREAFYDGTRFHRVIADFMIQGGDPTGTGRGGPGYRFSDEFKDNASTPYSAASYRARKSWMPCSRAMS